MRHSIYVLMLLACGPRGVQTTTDTDAGDADTDADADADADSDADTDTGLGGGDCTFDAGPWDQHPITAAGGTVTTGRWPTSGGVSALVAATIGTIDATVDITVTSAVVTSIDYIPAVPTENTATFWFEDADAAMTAHRLDLGAVDVTTLAPGDEVSFTATLVTDYFGVLEVTAATDFAIVSTGNPVPVVDGTATAFTAADVFRTGEAQGEITGTQGACGPSTCYDFTYGGGVITFRTDSDFVEEGTCVHYIGPIGVFEGAPQLDQANYDWAFTY